MFLFNLTSSRRFLLHLALTAALTVSSTAVAQHPRSVGREIPQATLAANVDQGEWWEDLRVAANEVREKRSSKKAVELFMELLLKGQQQNYGAPVEDRRMTSLRKFEPRYTEAARRDRIEGTVIMKVEFRADGFIGEVEVVKSLRSDLDLSAIEAARRIVFLPAVKDRKFVTSFTNVEMLFDLQ